eukprot:TRINITY_DN32320_c0_g1_i1.p1 TRINITY_DN32320_c0_g1~~TRINITY_DN32320_c0_g1_i1.p1  ORF type:complete len:647 (+),score=186.66 TRINITY_DN32320_c0_g1_i1:69-2009(+)
MAGSTVAVPEYGDLRVRRGSDAGVAALRTVSGVATREAFRTACLEVAEALAAIITPSYGPDGRMRCAVDMTGQASFTMQGSRLLLKARSTHPVAAYVLRHLKGYEGARGDGTKRWVLLLAAVLRELDGSLEAYGGVPASSVVRFRDACVAGVREELGKAGHVTQLPAEAAVRCAVAGVLMPGCAANIADALTTLLMNYIVGTHQGSGFQTLLAAPAAAANIRTVHGAALAQSKVVRGVLIEGRPSHPQMPKVVKGCRMLLLSGRPLVGKGGDAEGDSDSASSSSSPGGFDSPSSSDDDAEAAQDPRMKLPKPRKKKSGKVTYELTPDTLEEANEWAALAAKMFVLAVGSADVGAVVSSTPLPDAVYSECAQLGIIVADRVDRHDLRLLADAVGATPVEASTLLDPTVPVDAAQFPEVDTFEWMPLASSGGGAGSYLRVVPGAGRGGRHVPHTTILLAAPTPGLAEDYKGLVMRCIEAARFMLRPTVESGGAAAVPVVGGAGKALLIAARVARRCAAAVPAPHLRCLAEGVGNALESVVLAAMMNTLGPRGGHEARQLLTKAQGASQAVVATLAIAAKLPASSPRVASLCSVMDPEEAFLFEPAECVPHLLQSVLTAVGHLYRIDMLAPSKRLDPSGSQHVEQVPLV